MNKILIFKKLILNFIGKKLLILVLIFSLISTNFDLFLNVNLTQAALDPNELEYMIDVGPIAGTGTANYVYVALFNPSGSGRTSLIKRIAIRADANGTGNYVNLSLRRISAASGGTLIAASDIPKKNASSSNPVLEVRHTGPTVTFVGAVQSRLMGQPMPGAAGYFYSVRYISFGPNDEKIVLQPGEGIALYQEAGGTTAQIIRMYVEWEEVTTTPQPQNEYLLAIQRVENAAGVNYVYNSFFNPASSGKTAIVKRIWFGAETCDTTAVYTNNISIRRISSASGGTQIPQADIPKKHTGSANSVMDVRYGGPTVTLVGGTDARLGMITPCGAAGQPHGWMQINFHQNDEKLILQPGEGIALISEAAGDLDQLVRMIIEWKEVPVSETPSSQGEYILAFPRISDLAATSTGTTLNTFFNPSGSGKTVVIKRLVIRNDADGAATYSAFKFRRLTAASGGVLISAADIPKKHTGSPNSIIEARYCGTTCGTAITATYSGTTDSTLLQVNGPGNIGQVIGHREIVFGDNEKLVLQPGEGIGFYIDVTNADLDHYVKILIEWQETTTTPSSQGEYIIDPGPVGGSTATSYNYISFFNPSASGKTAIIKRISVRIDTVAAAVYIPMRVRRITSASGGTQITSANIPKKHSGTANSAMDIRKAGVTVTFAQGADAQLIGVETPSAVGAAAAPSLTGYRELVFINDEKLILQPGEGIVLHHDTSAGDADLRVKILIEWQEVDQANTPTSQGEYLMTIGPVAGSLNANYVYATIFNPSNSNKNYVVKRIGIRADRSGTLTAPGYIPITLRKITSASGGTQISNTDIPEKHTGTGASTSEIRHTNVTVTFAGITDSRFLGVTAPGAVNQSYGDYEIEIVFGDELILKPGEGIALYQEQAAGDTNIRFRFDVEWLESDIPAPSLTCTLSATLTSFSNLTPNAVSTSSPDITITATSSGAFQITVRDTGTSTGPGLYSSSTNYLIQSTDATLTAGTDGYGIQATTTNSNITINPKYNKSGNDVGGLSLTDIVLASSTVSVSSAQINIKHKASASYLAPVGSYSDTITYSCSAL